MCMAFKYINILLKKNNPCTGESFRQLPSQLISKRAQKFDKIDTASEVSVLNKPKDICSFRQVRLYNLEVGKLTLEKRQKFGENIFGKSGC